MTFKYEQDSLSIGIMSFLVLLRDNEEAFGKELRDHHWFLKFNNPFIDRVAVAFYSLTEFSDAETLDHMCSIAFAFMEKLPEGERYHLEKEVIMSLRDQESF